MSPLTPLDKIMLALVFSTIGFLIIECIRLTP